MQVDNKFWNATTKHLQTFGECIVANVKIAGANISKIIVPAGQIQEGIIYNVPNCFVHIWSITFKHLKLF